MPAKTVLFDTKANPTHDLGLSPRNFLQYQPQSRLLLVAGFGNLSGHIDVWDRKVMKKVADIRAPNASTCEWSPCGTFIMSQCAIFFLQPLFWRSSFCFASSPF